MSDSFSGVVVDVVSFFPNCSVCHHFGMADKLFSILALLIHFLLIFLIKNTCLILCQTLSYLLNENKTSNCTRFVKLTIGEQSVCLFSAFISSSLPLLFFLAY